LNPSYEIIEQLYRLDIDSGLVTQDQRAAQKELSELAKKSRISEEIIAKTRTDMSFNEAELRRLYKKLDDLEGFVPERMVSRLIGMGDIATLLEKADDVVDRAEQERVANRLMGGDFSLQDFLEQMTMVSQVGALQTLARYLPGVSQLSPEMLEKGQQEMKRFRAIISSMTKKERLVPSILNGDRRKRIAAGSGVTVQDVNHLIEKFEQSKQFVKMMKKSGAWRR
jgi:signal recognition particle subunit SRP54